MKRAALATLALLAAGPYALQAQMVPSPEPSIWGSTVRVTPFVGLAPTVSRTERWTVIAGPTTFSDQYDVDLSAGPAAGAAVEIRIYDRFAVIGSGAFITRGRTQEFSIGESAFFEYNGSNFLIGKAALAMRLRESVSEMQLRRLTATVFAGPAFVREMPKDDVSLHAVRLGAINHWGVAFGFDAELPMSGGRIALQGGVEDVVVWWNADELARRNDVAFAAEGLSTASFLDTDPSHNLLLRLGISVSFQ
jgi:hypothetical protein